MVIGAGQTGLATAYHLGRAGVTTASSCDEHRASATSGGSATTRCCLNTPAQYDGLPGMPFPAPRHCYPTGREMADYLEAYVERTGIDVRHETVVASVLRLDGRDVPRGQRRHVAVIATNVVVATGGEQQPRVPGRSPASSTPASGSCTRATTATRASCCRVRCWSSAPASRVPTSRSRSPGPGTRPWLSGRVNGGGPVPLRSRRKSRRALPVLWFLANHVLTAKTPIGRRLQPEVRRAARP